MDLREQLQKSLGQAYSVERELDGAGMSRVFVATDRRLNRQIVVKILAPDFAAGVNADRFEREIQVAAQLQHPQIVPVFSVGDADGMPFFTMPYVEGESLRDRLSRGPLPYREAIDILRDLAKALAYAHHHGVVHRDIKPDNVLLAGGSALVTDFGIAKAIAVSQRPGKRGTTLTQPGMTVGTPAYMAPEQAVGDAIDFRADIYAYGCLAYELLTGGPPFTDKNGVALLAAHLTLPPAPLVSKRPDVPHALAALVAQCLEKDPSARPAGAAAIIELLDRAAAEASSSQPASDTPTTDRRGFDGQSVAVLPFANLSPEADSEYFADGITEDIINAIARLKMVRVAGRASSFRFKPPRPDLEVIARELRVTSIVDGSIRRIGDRVRISAELVNPASGFVLWKDHFDRPMGDLFALQDEIAAAVASALATELTGLASQMSQPDATVHHTDNARAYELYLRGRHHWNQRPAGLVLAIDFFEQALQLDPAFAQAHVGVGDVYAAAGIYSTMPSNEAYERAVRALERALELLPDLPEAHASRGLLALYYEKDWARARRYLHDALQRQPHYPPALLWLTVLHSVQRELAEFHRMAAATLEVDPLSPIAHAVIGFLMQTAGDSRRSQQLCRKSGELDPVFVVADLATAWQAVFWGRPSEALAAADRYVTSTRSGNPALALRAAIYGALGRRADWQRDVDAVLKSNNVVHHMMLAQAFASVGDTERALEELEISEGEHEGFLVYAGGSRWFQQLQNEDRFKSLLGRLGIPIMPTTEFPDDIRCTH